MRAADTGGEEGEDELFHLVRTALVPGVGRVEPRGSEDVRGVALWENRGCGAETRAVIPPVRDAIVTSHPETEVLVGRRGVREHRCLAHGLSVRQTLYATR